MNENLILNNITTYGSEYIQLHNRQRLCYLLKCAYCDKLHYKEEHEIIRGIKRNKMFFCSRECRNNFSTTSMETNCANCNSIIFVKPNQIKKSETGNFFCNQSCAATFNNKIYPKRIKSIKLIVEKSTKPTPIYKCELCDTILDSNRKYCDSCKTQIVSNNSKKQNQEKYTSYILKWQAGEISGGRGEGAVSYHIRRYLFQKYDSKCSECGWAEINPITNKIPLEIDHIDGNWNNHKEDNLRLLCPSCHSITPTFRSLNNGRGRTNRRLKRQNGGNK